MDGHEMLRPYVCCILKETGFDSAENIIIESLTEILQSLLIEISKTCRSVCEATGRVQPLPADVTLAFVELGIRVNGLKEYAFRSTRYILPLPAHSASQRQPVLLSTGSKQQQPPHIPNHLPQFPDSHAYTRTPTHKKPVTEYEAIREKAANQKRDLERALNKFKTRTNETESLFFNVENDVFSLIASKVQSRSYLTALLPKDQVYDDEEDASITSPCKKSKTSKNESMLGMGLEDDEEEEVYDDENISKCDTEAIDNPFLRAIKMCPSWNSRKSGNL